MAISQRRMKFIGSNPIMVKVKFLADCDPGGGKPVFKKGSVKDIVASSATRWIRRGMAERYKKEKAIKKEPKKDLGNAYRQAKKEVKKKAEPKKKETELPLTPQPLTI